MIELPIGYELLRHERKQVLGGDWHVGISYKGEPAFELAKQYRVDRDDVEYAGKLVNGTWQQSSNLGELIKVMCAKHRIGVGK